MKEKEPFFVLAPQRVQYDEFWLQIRARNKWLIMLRYGAVIMLISLIIGMLSLKYTFDINYYQDTIPLWIITFSILMYNIIFHKYRNLDSKTRIEKFKIHGLRFSLIQICTDLLALMLFIYFTGGIDTPLYAFFIFHIIIGSLFLPSRIMYLIITLIILITGSGAYLESIAIIPHYHISGWIDFELYQDNLYMIVFFIIFSISLYLSVYLANSIARDLYTREKELMNALNEIKDAEKAKSRYVMTVVHDLKTPIAAATTYLNMILDKALGDIKEEQKRPFERSKFRLDQAIDSINNILQISQLKLSSKSDELQKIKVIDLFQEIYSEMNVLFKSKNLEFNLKSNEENIIVVADYTLLKLALSNLVSNAYKYTRNDGRVDVVIDYEGANVKISVIDNGIGIPLEQQAKIFQEFYRTPLSKKEGIEGTGLGMSLVKQIIDKFDGTITFKSPSHLSKDEHNPGTEFIVKLPLI